jgi:hypothetical protein
MIRVSRLASLLLLFFAVCPLHGLQGQVKKSSQPQAASEDLPFPGFPKLETKASGEWWKIKNRNLMVPRDQVVAFALYTHDNSTLKLSGQLYPLKPDETKEVRLEFHRDGKWQEIQRKEVLFPGWSVHFRIENWDNSVNVPYRLLHGEKAFFMGMIRRDPIDKNEIVIGNLSCNSSRTPGPRPKLVEKRKRIGDWELDLVRCHRASGYLITAVDRMTGSAREKSGPQVQ